MKEDRPFIPVCEPTLVGNEERYAMEAVGSGWISSSGRFIGEFETKFAAYLGVKHAITCSSGTAALHLALKALGVGPGDEVILPSFTMVAVLNSVLYCGAKPVFVDVDDDTWNMSAEGVREKISSRTKAVIPVHTYGHPVEMEPLFELAEQGGFAVLEDAAEAHGATYQGRQCGSIGTIAAFSFFANKIITTGEGGMVTTSDDELADRCRYYKNLCFPLQGERDYIHAELGYNYRMTNTQAAIGLGQLENIEKFVDARRDNARRYNERLREIPGIQLPVEKDYAKNVYWMYGIVIDEAKFGCSRDELKRQLRERNIDSRYFFKPLHSQPLLSNYGVSAEGDYPVTELLAQAGLYLPSSSKLTDAEIERICDAIRDIHEGC